MSAAAGMARTPAALPRPRSAATPGVAGAGLLSGLCDVRGLAGESVNPSVGSPAPNRVAAHPGLERAGGRGTDSARSSRVFLSSRCSVPSGRAAAAAGARRCCNAAPVRPLGWFQRAYNAVAMAPSPGPGPSVAAVEASPGERRPSVTGASAQLTAHRGGGRSQSPDTSPPPRDAPREVSTCTSPRRLVAVHPDHVTFRDLQPGHGGHRGPQAVLRVTAAAGSVS